MAEPNNPRRRPVRATALALVCLIVAGSGCSVGPNRDRSHPADPRGLVEFALALRLPGQARLDRFLNGLGTPGSPSYHRFVGAGEFGARFGLSDGRMHALRAALNAAGLEVTWEYPQRTSLGVRGQASDVGRFFGISFGMFRDRWGRRYRAPTGRPVIPASIRSMITSVVGLSGREVMHPGHIFADVPSGGLKPRDAAKAYDVGPLWDAGIHGEGQTIAILSLDSFRASDVQLYDRTAGIPPGGSPVERVPVEGGATVGPGRAETALDIDVIRGIAPMAHILNYEGKDTKVNTSIQVLNQIIEDGRADIVSDSWGTCDDPQGFSQPVRDAMNPVLEAAVAQGISIFVASGDAGAYDCQAGNLSDQLLTVDWPASSPNAIAVGGTRLSVQQNGTYLTEFGWEDVLSNSGGGGGLNPVDPRPSWQVGTGLDADHRQVPDVSASADPDSGWYVVVDGDSQPVGGTSAAAPFWAGSMLLIRQYADQQGAGKLGFVNPMLYQLAQPGQPAPAFHDVVRGGNRHFNAGRGWDYATGLGSPDVFNLAQDVVAYLKQHPA